MQTIIDFIVELINPTNQTFKGNRLTKAWKHAKFINEK